MMQDPVLHVAACAVRSAFRVAEPEFPHLRCVESARVLQHVLNQLGYPARVFSGEFRLDKTLPNSPEEPEEGLTLNFAHDWVEAKGTVVDITGDQFDPGLNFPWAPIYIGPHKDRYVGGVEVDSDVVMDDPVCQAVLFELRALFPTRASTEGPEAGIGADDFTLWDLRDPGALKRLMVGLTTLGEKVRDHSSGMTFHGVGRILPDEVFAWMTWAPAEFGDSEAYRHRPHITLDVTPKELVLHINLELAKNADHFAALVKRDPRNVLDNINRLGCGLELQVYQRRQRRVRQWDLERPAFYPVCDLTPDKLLEAVLLAKEWGKREGGTRQAYFVSQRIPAARAIALGAGLPAELARRIAQLRPGLDFFDWRR